MEPATGTYLRTDDIPLATLTPFPGNARRGNVELILSSLRRNGQYRGLVVRHVQPDGPLIVLAGNHTMQALALHGPGDCGTTVTTTTGEQHPCGICQNNPAWEPRARCEIVTCDDDTARRINLADNRTAELGQYDSDALAELLSYLDGDYEGTGYTEDDVAFLLDYPEPEPALTDPDHTPEPPTDPISKPGDIWHLGPHRLMCGDSTDMAAVETMLDGDRAHCMWTDPPYGVDYVGGSHALSPAERLAKGGKTIQNDATAEDLPELLAGAFAVATAVLKPGAPFYIAHPDSYRNVFEQAVRDAGWLFRQNLIWAKDTLVLGRSDYHYRHEPILYGFTDPEPGSGRLGRGGDRWFGDNAQTTVFEVPKPARNEDHPTMKPVELVVRCLTNSCPPGGLVYEPFGGSGTTLIAAHTARVVELDPRYVDVICRRYQQHTGTKPVLASTGQPHDFTSADANP